MSYPIYPFVWPREEDNIPDIHEENRQLREENERLKTRIDTLLSKEASILETVKAVYCPSNGNLINAKECGSCDYCKNKIIIGTCEGYSIEYIYCACPMMIEELKEGAIE